jgi:hypothetical protein
MLDSVSFKIPYTIRHWHEQCFQCHAQLAIVSMFAFVTYTLGQWCIFCFTNTMKGYFTASGKGWLLAGRGIALILLAELAAIIVSSGEWLLSGQLLFRGVITLVLAVVLMPSQGRGEPPAIAIPLVWSLLSAIALLCGLVGVSTVRVSSGTALALAQGIAVLVFLFGCWSFTLAYYFNDRRLAARITLVILLLCLTLPLWAAPFAALYGASQWLVDTIVALCPISYLAALTEIDYLRGIWFYQHTPYGSLKYDYPNPAYTTILILLSSLSITFLTRFSWPGRRLRKLTETNTQPLESHV